MTDQDKIELPLLPRADFSYSTEAMERYGRAAVLADRKHRAEQAKPKVYSVALSLGPDNSWSCYAWAVHPALATVTLSWTDDGRAWIDNKRNRELAKWLRMWQGATGNEAADALDGGVR